MARGGLNGDVQRVQPDHERFICFPHQRLRSFSGYGGDILLAAIVASSDDAIVSKDLNGIIRSWNRGAEHIFGYRADEVIGQPLSILAVPERANEMPGLLARIRRGERVEHYETVRRRKDGQRITVSLTISPIRNRAGEIIGASKIARDITETKDLERALRTFEEQSTGEPRTNNGLADVREFKARSAVFKNGSCAREGTRKACRHGN